MMKRTTRTNGKRANKKKIKQVRSNRIGWTKKTGLWVQVKA